MGKWREWETITTIKVNRKVLYKLNKLRKSRRESWSDILARSLMINNSLWKYILYKIGRKIR